MRTADDCLDPQVTILTLKMDCVIGISPAETSPSIPLSSVYCIIFQ